jgi:hypothetical protein
MKRLAAILKIAIFAALIAGPIGVRADTIFSNFTPAGSSPDFPYGVDTGELIAGTFTPSANFTLSEVDVALWWVGTEGGRYPTNDGATILLESNAAGLPSGSVLESWTLTSLPLGTSYAYAGYTESLVSTGGVTLTSGTQYWVVAETADTTTVDAWDLNNTAQLGGASSGNGGATWSLDSSGLAPAFDVLGTPVAALEGGSALLFVALDLVAFLALRSFAPKLRAKLIS